MVDVAREPGPKRRKVLATLCILAVTCAVIAAWPNGEPAASAARPAGHRELDPPSTTSSTGAQEPQRLEIAGAANASSEAIDDASSVVLCFDCMDSTVAGQPPMAPLVGPADGVVQLASPLSPLRLHVHAPTQEWLIQDGLLRRLRSRVGERLAVPLGQAIRNPSHRFSWLGGVDASIVLPSGLAAASFREITDETDLGTVAFVGKPTARDPVFLFRVNVLTTEGAPATRGIVAVTNTATGDVEWTEGGHTLYVSAGSYAVRAGSTDGGRADQVVDVRANTTIQLVLQRRAELRGRVVDRDGVPVARSRIVWTGSGEYRNQALTDDDGTFVVHDVLGAVGTVWACVPGDTLQLPAVGRVVAPGEAIELVLDRARCRCSLRVRIAVPHGVPTPDVTARLWQQESELGVRLDPRDQGESSVELGRDDVPAGHYRLELHCPGFGVIDAGTHWLDGSGAVALDFALPAPAHVTFALPAGAPSPAADAFELVRVGAAVDIVIQTNKPFAGPHLLGPGRYAIWWRGAAGVRSHEFQVTSSGEQTVDLGN